MVFALWGFKADKRLTFALSSAIADEETRRKHARSAPPHGRLSCDSMSLGRSERNCRRYPNVMPLPTSHNRRCLCFLAHHRTPSTMKPRRLIRWPLVTDRERAIFQLLDRARFQPSHLKGQAPCAGACARSPEWKRGCKRLPADYRESRARFSHALGDSKAAGPGAASPGGKVRCAGGTERRQGLRQRGDVLPRAGFPSDRKR